MQTPVFKNEMLELDGIIRKDITRFLDDNYPLTDALFHGFNHELADSVREVKKRIATGALQYGSKDGQRRYVLYQQQVLSELADKLTIHAAPAQHVDPKRSAESRTLLLSLNRALQDLFDFINTFFASALPGEQWLSANYYSLVREEVAEGLDRLHANLFRLKVSKELVSLALAPLAKFVDHATDNDLTYHRQTFIKKLKNELTKLYESLGERTTDEDIHQLLFKLNFNSLAYLAYIGKDIRKSIDKIPTIGKKIEKLHQMKRDAAQIVQLPEVIFDVHNPQLKEYTLAWLTQEITFWERVHELPADTSIPEIELGPPEKPHLVYHGLPTQKPRRLKTKFNLSVKVSAFFLTVMRETEIIEETDMRELTRDLSAIFRSKEREFVSAQSFYKKLSNIDTSTATTLRNILLKLVKHIETKYGIRP